MSTILTDIHDALKSEISSELGSSVQELQYIYAVEMNNVRGIKDGWGVKILSGVESIGITKHHTTAQTFEVILTTTSGRQNDDSDLVSAVLTLRDRADDILNRIYLKKLGLPSTVMLVANHSYGEPEFFDENGFIVQRMQVDITYRRSIT